MGRPRSPGERAVQWLWRWRIELVLAEVAIAGLVAIALEIVRP